MKNIFRLPVDNQHFTDTIENGKSLSEVSDFLSGEDKTKLNRAAKDGIVRYWGSIPGDSNNRNFEKLQENDEILCYRSGHYISLCIVDFKIINPQLARHSWGQTETGKTWELIYFFKEVILFKIDATHVNSAFGFKEAGSVMGFNAVSEDKTKEFISKYGSVREFIKRIGVDRKLESTIKDEIENIKIKSPFEAQFYLVDLGNKLEFNTYVPASDSGRMAFDKRLKELVTIQSEELRDYVAPVVFDPLSHIDVIWFKDNYQPKFFFEVIHKTGWSEAFLRLDLATKHYEMSKARIIGSKENEQEFQNAIRRWTGPKDNLLYKDYDQLINVHSETLYHNRLVDDFLS